MKFSPKSPARLPATIVVWASYAFSSGHSTAAQLAADLMLSEREAQRFVEAASLGHGDMAAFNAWVLGDRVRTLAWAELLSDEGPHPTE